jgi:hypothetical protein
MPSRFFVSERLRRGIASDKKPGGRFYWCRRSFAECKEAADAEKYGKFADAHRKRVYAKTLARARRRSGDLNWTPIGMLSGGGMLFSAQVDSQLRKLYGRIGA